MDEETIKTKLADLFKHYRVVFWDDPDGDFEDFVKTLELDGVQLLRRDEQGDFKSKIILDIDQPDENFLIYAAKSPPDIELDWLLDARLYGYEFKADRASMLLGQLNLNNHHLHEHLQKRQKFFNSKERTARLEKIVKPDDNETELDRKMLSVVVGSEHNDFFEILRTIFHKEAKQQSLDGQSDAWQDVAKFDLEESFWAFANDYCGYDSEDKSLKNLLIRLFVTDLAYSLGEYLPVGLRHFVLPENKQANVAVCLNQWRDSSSKSESYDYLADKVGDILQIGNQLDDVPAEKLYSVETFLPIEKKIASSLREIVKSSADTINPEEIRKIANNRCDCHWANCRLESTALVPRQSFNDVYQAICLAADFFCLKNLNQDNLVFNSASEMFNAYTKDLYRFDTYYRKFCDFADETDLEGWNILKDLRTMVEDTYCNWFLSNLSLEWDRHIDLDNWTIDGVTNQYDFYKRYVSSSAGQKTSRGRVTAYVIISDAFRYEAAKELNDALNSKYRFTAELDSMLGVLPSFTAIGMAALLPGNDKAFSDRAEVVVDGKAVGSVEQRNEHLTNYYGAAISSSELMAMKKDEGRDFVKDKNVVYIYNDTIDSTAHNAGNEDAAFRAVSDAVNELANVVKYLINNLNASTVFVTADHGFIYSRRKPQDTERSELEDIVSDSVVSKKKRYLIGRNLPEVDSVLQGDLGKTSGFKNDYNFEFILPNGITLFHFMGGAKFFHGGASLQEIVVPVLKAGRVRGKDAEKTRGGKVKVQVLGDKHKITTNRHRFQLLQTEAASGRMKPVTLKIAVYEGAEPVTDIETVTFESSSENISERTKDVMLTLKNIAYDRNKKYYLVLRDADDDVEVSRIAVVIDRVFTSDF